MSDRDLIVATVREVLKRECTPDNVAAARGSWQPELWTTLADLGVTMVGVPEEAGGVGGTLADAVAVVRTAAEYAAAVPIAETLLAAWILGEAGLPLPSEPATIAPGACTAAGGKTSIRAQRVSWAGVVSLVTVVDERAELVAVVPAAGCVIEPGTNLADEPCGDVTFDGTGYVAPLSPRWRDGGFSRHGALLRSAQIAGALASTLLLTIEYVSQREQFGRPIGEFQAVQHQLAELAALAKAVEVGVEAAAETADEFALEAVKAYASAACGRGAAIAHQLHGAIGLTEEHPLHLFTRRLWSWRDDFGTEHHWGSRVAGRLAAAGAERLWPMLTSTEALT